jgi:hypothetical protein
LYPSPTSPTNFFFLPLLSRGRWPSPRDAFSCRRRPAEAAGRCVSSFPVPIARSAALILPAGRPPATSVPRDCLVIGRLSRTGGRFFIHQFLARSLFVVILPRLLYYSSISSVLVRLDWKVAVVGMPLVGVYLWKIVVFSKKIARRT